MDAIPWADLLPVAGSGGGWLLALYFIRLVFSGQMIPRSVYLEQREVADSWKAAYESERDKTEKVLMPMAELQTHVLKGRDDL